LRLGTYLGGDNIAVCGDEKNVVKSQSFGNRGNYHFLWFPARNRLVDSLISWILSIVESPTGTSKLDVRDVWKFRARIAGAFAGGKCADIEMLRDKMYHENADDFIPSYGRAVTTPVI
jgi:hypothetical protein